MGSSGGGAAAAITRIAEQVLAADAASIIIAGIPQTYQHLLLVGRFKVASALSTNFRARFNADAAANYNTAYHVHAGGAYSAIMGPDTTSIVFGITGANVADADIFTGFRAWLYDYRVAHNKIAWFDADVQAKSVAQGGNGERRGAFGGGSWQSNAAITQVTLFIETGVNLLAGSQAILYGLTN